MELEASLRPLPYYTVHILFVVGTITMHVQNSKILKINKFKMSYFIKRYFDRFSPCYLNRQISVTLSEYLGN